MARSEQEFIDILKRQIEQRYSFGNGHGHTQRDLELLVTYIEERTAVAISLSTLKRLWKDDYKQSPQMATLNSLAQILDHKDWHSFKLAHQPKPKTNKTLLGAGVAVVILLTTGVVVMYLSSRPVAAIAQSIKINGPITFEAVKTVSTGVPNTVIFKYDLSNVIADTFYIQQSWNPDHREVIDPTGSAWSSIYYESGYHRAKLVAGDSIIATQPVHIISNGWEPHLYHRDSDPELIDFKAENFISGGTLHIDRDILTKRHVDFSKRFLSRITNSRVFDVHSDNFSFSTRMRADSIFDRPCGWMDLAIITEVQTFSVSWTKKGCEKFAAYKLGEIQRKGKDNDLSALGCRIFDWQELDIIVKERVAEIRLNGKPVFREHYQQDFGKIVALIYFFDGTGSIDYARLKNGEGEITFEDNF